MGAYTNLSEKEKEMRKATLKCEKAFYTGQRIAYSNIMNDLILLCYDKPEYTGLMDTYRRYYREAQNKELSLEHLIYDKEYREKRIK